MMNDSRDLELIFRSRIPLVAIESREERRAMELLLALRQRLTRPLYKWSVTEGVVSMEFGFAADAEHIEPAEVLMHIKAASRPGIYVLVDFHPFLNDPVHVRLLKDIALQHNANNQTVVLLSHELELPEELSNFSASFELSLPDKATIKNIVKDIAREWTKENSGQKVKTNRDSFERLLQNLSGLTAAEVRRLAHNVIYDDGAIGEADLPRVMKAKYELLNKDGVLHFEYETERFSDVGGFKRLKQWLEQREAVFKESKPGLDMPKGILLLGVQGCGKSLAAKATAGVWGLPLLRFDFGTLFNKYHGETERNLRESLKSAEAMAPCVLWIDEIEKGVSGDDNDSGTSKRVLGSLLTWMAERESAVFLVATANDITALPPELIRKGRFDEIFFVDLPDLAARKNIFEIHLRKRGIDPIHFNLAEQAKQTDGFSGAEIEQCVVSALYSAHAQKSALLDEHLLTEINHTRPLSVVMAEKIAQLRAWAAERTVSAN